MWGFASTSACVSRLTRMNGSFLAWMISVGTAIRSITFDAAARDRSVLWGVVDVRPAEALEGADGVPIPVFG